MIARTLQQWHPKCLIGGQAEITSGPESTSSEREVKNFPNRTKKILPLGPRSEKKYGDRDIWSEECEAGSDAPKKRCFARADRRIDEDQHPLPSRDRSGEVRRVTGRDLSNQLSQAVCEVRRMRRARTARPLQRQDEVGRNRGGPSSYRRTQVVSLVSAILVAVATPRVGRGVGSLRFGTIIQGLAKIGSDRKLLAARTQDE